MSLRTCLFASLFVVAAACGGEGGAGPVDQSTAEDGCQQICDYDVACGDTADPACVQECTDDVVGVFREDVFLDAVECVTALECDASDDICLTQCEPTSTHQQYEDRCREELAACGVTGDGLDESCEVTPMVESDIGFFCILATPIIEDLLACFDEPDCQAIATCQQAVIDQINL